MAAEQQVAQLLAAMEQMNNRVIELERQVHQGADGGRRPRGGLVDKGIQPGVFDGTNYHSWAEDLMAIVGAKNEKLGELMKWAEDKGEAGISLEEATLQNHGVTEGEVRELYVYLMHHLLGEPRIIAKGAAGNGAEAWRKLKVRYDPISETSQVNILLQVLQPTKAKNNKEILPCIERWEEGLRRQQTITGVEPLTDGTKRALLIKMCTPEVSRHLQLNARHLDSYEKMRWKVVNYVQLSNPSDPIAMYVDHLEDENWSYNEDETEIYYMAGDKGKSKGKGKSYGENKGKGKGVGRTFKGMCWHCGEPGHRAAECPKKGSKGGKGKGKAKFGVDHVEEYTENVTDTGSIEIIDMFALDNHGNTAGNVKGKNVGEILSEIRQNISCNVVDKGDSVDEILRKVRATMEENGSSTTVPPPPPLPQARIGLLGSLPPPAPLQPARVGLLGGRFRPSGTKKEETIEKDKEHRDAATQVMVEVCSVSVQTNKSNDDESDFGDPDGMMDKVDSDKNEPNDESNLEDTGDPDGMMDKVDSDKSEPDDESNFEDTKDAMDEVETVANELDSDGGNNEYGNGGEVKLFDLDALDEWGNEVLTVTVDSGAAESVMPVDALPEIPMSDGPASRKYRAAGGKLLDDRGEKKVVYWGVDGRARRMTFRVADVTKPLASVKRICDQGNRVVFDGPNSHIEHKTSGWRTPMREENGVYVLDVPVVDTKGEGFTRQGR